MSERSMTGARTRDADASSSRARLTVDLDVDICVVGAGLAGLTVAREASRLGASVAVLEGRHIGWNASGNQIGTVMPGFGLPIADLIERVGLEDARELWALSREGAGYVRATATEDLIPGIGLSEGALEVSNVDAGERLLGRLRTLNEDFGAEAEGWQIDRVRSELKTARYFHGIYYPNAFQVDGRKYVHGLAALARQAGANVFENTPVVSIDASGIRKRIVTPSARLRVGHVVLAGNVHLGAPQQRLSETLLPVWRYGALTERLGDRLTEAIAFGGSVVDSDGIDHFRIVDGDRLMWVSPEATWEVDASRFASAVQRRIAAIFPQLGKVGIAQTFGGVIGLTVHGMPQVGQLDKGLWIASGFGRQGMQTSAAGGLLVARGILRGDERWRQFSPFELVWAGGRTGRVAAQLIGFWNKGASAAAGALARHREAARAKKRARLVEASRQAATRPPPRRRVPQGSPRAAPRTQAPAPARDGGSASQESERAGDGSV